MLLTLDGAILETLREKAGSASRLVGHLDACATNQTLGPLAHCVEGIAYTLAELLRDPELISPARIAQPSLANEPTRAGVASRGDVPGAAHPAAAPLTLRLSVMISPSRQCIEITSPVVVAAVIASPLARTLRRRSPPRTGSEPRDSPLDGPSPLDHERPCAPTGRGGAP
jgi:hypothetical protein